MKRIEITVGPKGTTQVETKGFVGDSCLEASEFIKQALGKQSTPQKTAEFFQPASQDARVDAQN